MLKYLFLYLILVTNLFSSNSEVMMDKEMKNIIDSLPSVPSQTILQEVGFDDVNKSTLSKKEMLKNEYKKFQFAIEQINDDSFKKIAIDNLNEALYKLDNNEEIIIFYFISADTNEENIRSFMKYIDVLNSHFPSIKGKILLNNYPENLVDDVNRKLDFHVEPFEKDSGKGIIKVFGDGSYTYKVKEINGMKPNEKYQDIPIMVISAKTSEIDKVIGIDLGADDYLVKPFGVLELVSRVKALLRRSAKQEQKSQTIEINGLVLDKESHEVFYLTKEIVLTKKQFELLEYLMSKPNKTLTREDLLNQVWGFDFVGESRTLDVHIKELRRKMQISGIDKTSIETVRSVGYKFVL